MQSFSTFISVLANLLLLLVVNDLLTETPTQSYFPITCNTQGTHTALKDVCERDRRIKHLCPSTGDSCVLL